MTFVADFEPTPLWAHFDEILTIPRGSKDEGKIREYVIQVAERIHANKGHLFVDAVQFAPHGPLDVSFFGCDFLVCSGYKIFGPHMGFLWGKKDLLDSLPTFREFFVNDQAPDKYELGTLNYEAVAGMNAAIGYVEDLGRRLLLCIQRDTRRCGRIEPLDVRRLEDDHRGGSARKLGGARTD